MHWVVEYLRTEQPAHHLLRASIWRTFTLPLCFSVGAVTSAQQMCLALVQCVFHMCFLLDLPLKSYSSSVSTWWFKIVVKLRESKLTLELSNEMGGNHSRKGHPVTSFEYTDGFSDHTASPQISFPNCHNPSAVTSGSGTTSLLLNVKKITPLRSRKKKWTP